MSLKDKRRLVLDKLYWSAHETGVQKNMPNDQKAINQALSELEKLDNESRLTDEEMYDLIKSCSSCTFDEFDEDWKDVCWTDIRGLAKAIKQAKLVKVREEE